MGSEKEDTGNTCILVKGLTCEIILMRSDLELTINSDLYYMFHLWQLITS